MKLNWHPTQGQCNQRSHHFRKCRYLPLTTTVSNSVPSTTGIEDLSAICAGAVTIYSNGIVSNLVDVDLQVRVRKLIASPNTCTLDTIDDNTRIWRNTQGTTDCEDVIESGVQVVVVTVWPVEVTDWATVGDDARIGGIVLLIELVFAGIIQE